MMSEEALYVEATYESGGLGRHAGFVFVFWMFCFRGLSS
jgi:hypothetical protein